MTNPSDPLPNPSTPPTPEPEDKPAKTPKVKKPGRWRRRTIWTLSIVIVLVFVVRALVPLALPTVLQKVAGTFGLTCSYDHFELNIFSGDAGIWGIKVLPKEGGPAILQTEYCHGNLAVMDLFKGKLSVWRAEADGVDVNLDRNADGHIPLLDRFISSKAAQAQPAPTPSGSSKPIDLSSPLRLDALRLGHIRVHIHDRGITPEVDTELAMDLRLSDLGSTTSPAKFEMNLSADPLLETLRITGEGTSGGKKLDAKMDILCRGIRLKSAAAYLQPLGIVPIGDSITLRAAGSVHTSAAPNDAEGFTGSLAFDHLSATVDGTEAMALDSLSLSVDAIDTKSIHLGKLLIDGARATAGRGADGNIRVLGLEYAGVTKSAAKTTAAPSSNGKEMTQNVIYGDGLAPPDPIPFEDTRADHIYTGPAMEERLSKVDFLVADKQYASVDSVILASTSSPNSAKPTKPAGPPAIVASLLAEPWSLGEASIHNARIMLLDQGVSPAVNLSLVAEELSAKNIDHDPGNLNKTIALSGKVHADGLVRDINLTGSIQPFADKKTLQGSVEATGIRPVAVKPYLDLIGIESQLKNAAFTGSVKASLSIADNGDLSADAKVGKLVFKDDADLLSLNGITLAGMTLAPSTGEIGVQSIEVSGPGITAMREKTGNFAALGFRTKPHDATAPVAPPATPATAGVQPAPAAKPVTNQAAPQGPTIASLPRITIGRVTWKDIKVNLQDQAVQPPVTLTLSDVGVEMKNLTTNLSNGHSAVPGSIHAWLVAPEVAKRLDCVADIIPRASGLDLDADVNGTGITLAGLANYLKPLGIEPTLTEGQLAVHAKASVDQTDDKKLALSLVADHMSYRDGPTELSGFDEVGIRGVSLTNGELDIDSVQVTHPRTIARRNADGTLEADGIRLVKAAPVATNIGGNSTAATVQAGKRATSGVPLPTTNEVAAAPPIPFVIVVKKLAVEDSSATWSDAAVTPAVNLTAGATVHLDNFVFGRPADPATLNITAHADGAADNCTVSGKLAAGLDAQSIQLDITATGVRAGPLTAYFPPGLASSLKDGRFHGTIDAGLSKNPAGGLAARLVVGPSDFRDGPADPPLFKLDSVRVDVPRIDLPDTALAVNEISVTGVETHAEKMPDGTLQVLGLVLGGKTDAAAIARPAAAAPVPAPAFAADSGNRTDRRVGDHSAHRQRRRSDGRRSQGSPVDHRRQARSQPQ